MRNRFAFLSHSLKRRVVGLSTSASSSSSSDKIVASVLFERLPVVIPKIEPAVYAFQEFSYRWTQQYRRKYPDEVLGKSDARGKGDYHIDYVPAPRVTEADKNNDRRLVLILLMLSTFVTCEPVGTLDASPDGWWMGYLSSVG
ncbi:hypothetical protein IFM89_027524 [Coptis chinensis]|uniref:Uncharacterized protein n=1 Tax=Coptis chinensis TaxID=261450 RepID=A0A835LPA4_9MAGN|nr:hypothetical protein IFM89_027524 [Coptis chinensis]